jgi:hypothetical protein
MNIMERYVSAYIVECLTGYKGEFPEYIELIRVSRPRHPLLKKVVRAVKYLDPRSTEAVNRVKKIMRSAMSNGWFVSDDYEDPKIAGKNILHIVGKEEKGNVLYLVVLVEDSQGNTLSYTVPENKIEVR